MKRYCCLAVFAALLPLAVSAQKMPSFTPEQFKDDPAKEWCYLQKSLTAIGVPFQKTIHTVTYDGSLFNRHNELNLYYGESMTPVFARQKTFMEGWIPVVQYDWTEDGFAYALEMFAYPLDGYDSEGSVGFVKISAKNVGRKSAKAYLTAGTRGYIKDYRDHFSGMDLGAEAAMGEGEVTLGGKTIYTFDSTPTSKFSVDGEVYSAPFILRDKGVGLDTPFASVMYVEDLKPGASMECVFKQPLVPAEGAFAEAIKAADYDSYLEKTIAYWRAEIGDKAHFSIPEARVDNAYKASLVHLMLATRTFKDGRKSQTDGVPYPMFFLTSGPQMILAYLEAGNFEMAKMLVSNAITQQEPDGLYFDRSLAHGGVIPTAHGHVLYMIGAYWAFTHDEVFMEKAFPSIVKAMDYIKNATAEDEYGLLPPTYQYDNEMIDGHYTSNNLWALLGLRMSIRIALDLGKTSEAEAWTALEKEYSGSIMRGVEASVRPDGYVPTGLYPYKVGKEALRKFSKFRSDCDWENMLLAYPIELLEPSHPYVEGTLKHVRKGYAEGVMTYRHGLHLHQYITANMIEQYMVRGESEMAITDFYHLLLHCGSTHEGFENMVWPWQNRELISVLPPHAWASAKAAVLTRNLLLYEYGGKCGKDPDRELFLLSTLSPEWLKKGDVIEISDAPVENGTVSATLTSKKKKAVLRFRGDFRTAPPSVKFRIPYCKELVSFKSDDKSARLEDGCVVLNPGFNKLVLKWKDKPEAYTDNFARLLELYRDCNVFLTVDEADEEAPVVREGKAFLKPGEKDGRRDILNFELVKNAFLYEMDRRHADGEVPDYKSQKALF